MIVSLIVMIHFFVLWRSSGQPLYSHSAGVFTSVSHNSGSVDVVSKHPVKFTIAWCTMNTIKLIPIIRMWIMIQQVFHQNASNLKAKRKTKVKVRNDVYRESAIRHAMINTVNVFNVFLFVCLRIWCSTSVHLLSVHQSWWSDDVIVFFHCGIIT